MFTAKTDGAVKEGGKVLSVQLWARPSVKKVLVDESKAASMKMSQFVLLQALKNIAREKKVAIDELVPEEDYKYLLYRKRGHRAERKGKCKRCGKKAHWGRCKNG